MNVPVALPGTILDDEARTRLIEAALAMFAERGFHGTSVPEVARAARVGVGSVYRRFESKERLVNEVFREAKGRLRDALLLGFDLARPPEALFADLWARLSAFQKREPLAFQFLEMQDHQPYLDGESRAVERSVLVPIVMATHSLVGDEKPPLPPEVLIAMIWGAFVGLTKAERLGYLRLDEGTLKRAGEVCFSAVASSLALGKPEEKRASRSSAKPSRKGASR